MDKHGRVKLVSRAVTITCGAEDAWRAGDSGVWADGQVALLGVCDEAARRGATGGEMHLLLIQVLGSYHDAEREVDDVAWRLWL
jgi:hypothetical protein